MERATSNISISRLILLLVTILFNISCHKTSPSAPGPAGYIKSVTYFSPGHYNNKFLITYDSFKRVVLITESDANGSPFYTNNYTYDTTIDHIPCLIERTNNLFPRSSVVTVYYYRNNILHPDSSSSYSVQSGYCNIASTYLYDANGYNNYCIETAPCLNSPNYFPDTSGAVAYDADSNIILFIDKEPLGPTDTTTYSYTYLQGHVWPGIWDATQIIEQPMPKITGRGSNKMWTQRVLTETEHLATTTINLSYQFDSQNRITQINETDNTTIPSNSYKIVFDYY